MSIYSRVDLQPAYLLHLRPYRDTSAIVEMFTAEYGRVGAVAVAVKSPKSKWRGLLQAFQPLLISWRGRSDLVTLSHAESSGRHQNLPGVCLTCGLYLNELLLKLSPRMIADVELFSAYHGTLQLLSTLDKTAADFRWALQAALRYFELDLLQSLGYAVTLDREAGNGRPVQEPGEYCFYPEVGPVRVDSQSLPTMREPSAYLQREPSAYLMYGEIGLRMCGHTLLRLQARQLPLSGDVDAACSTVYAQAKRLTRLLLDQHLGYKPLHSRGLLEYKSLKV